MKTQLEMLILAYGKEKAKNAFKWYELAVPANIKNKVDIFECCYFFEFLWNY